MWGDRVANQTENRVENEMEATTRCVCRASKNLEHAMQATKLFRA